MTITQDGEIDIFVGSKIGSLKHIKFFTDSSRNSKKCIENLVDIKSLTKDDGITRMQWASAAQTDILIGRKNGKIEVFSTVEQRVTETHEADFGEGHIVGLGCCGERLVAALSGGTVRVWERGGKGEELRASGGPLDIMRLCPDVPEIYATGGEENDLKLWTVASPSPTFLGKNLPHDSLQLRRPVWVSDLALPAGEGGRLAAVASRHGYVRLYDSRAQRRPVINVELPNMAVSCIATGLMPHEFVVGTSRGALLQVDVRARRAGRQYRGAAGAVRALGAVAAHSGLLLSAGLDRRLRVHRYCSKELLYTQYLTSKLTALLVQTSSSTPLRLPPAEPSAVKSEREALTAPGADDLDDIFDAMETVGEKPKKRKPQPEPEPEEQQPESSKPSTEGSTTPACPEAAIRELLRSTERIKRKRDRLRREKRARSLYHNA